MARLGRLKFWLPAELSQAPFLLGMGLVIAYDALTPFLDSNISCSLVSVAGAAEVIRTALFLIVAFFASQVRLLLNRTWPLVLLCFGASGGLVLSQLSVFVSQPYVATATAIAGAFGIGFFWCLALLKFYELFTKVSLRCVLVAFIFCHLLGSAIGSFVVCFSARALALVLLFLIPLVLLFWGRSQGALILSTFNPNEDGGVFRRRVPLRPFTLMLITLFIAALVRAHIPPALEPSTYFGPLICALMLSAVVEVNRRAVHPRTLYHLTLFLLLTGLLLYTQKGVGALVASGGSVNAGYLCFDILILALLSNVCHRYAVNSYWMFGLLGFIERVAYSSGSIAGALLNAQVADMRYNVAFCCAIVTTCAFIALLTEKDYRTSWGTVRDEDRINPVASYYQTLPDVCATVSEQYGLSPREEDVLLLLSQRKTIPDVERELFISNSTAKTHCKNIYKKLGIHKRDELLAMMGHPSVSGKKESDANQL